MLQDLRAALTPVCDLHVLVRHSPAQHPRELRPCVIRRARLSWRSAPGEEHHQGDDPKREENGVNDGSTGDRDHQQDDSKYQPEHASPFHAEIRFLLVIPRGERPNPRGDIGWTTTRGWGGNST